MISAVTLGSGEEIPRLPKTAFEVRSAALDIP
jgi:hypothetical protein